MPDYPSTALDRYEKRTSKGQPNGYAGLGPDGKIPTDQISPNTFAPSGGAGGVLGGSFPNPSLAAVLLAIPQAFGAGQSATAAVIATASTISTSGVGVARVAPSGIATGVVLQPGSSTVAASGYFSSGYFPSGYFPSVYFGGSVASAPVTAVQVANPWLIVSNEAASSLTFAASGTSHVASGTACQIKGGGALLFVWNSATSLWYPVA